MISLIDSEIIFTPIPSATGRTKSVCLFLPTPSFAMLLTELKTSCKIVKCSAAEPHHLSTRQSMPGRLGTFDRCLMGELRLFVEAKTFFFPQIVIHLKQAPAIS